MITDAIPRVAIAHLPTPIEPLPRLTAQLDGPEIWVKRDDQTGLATGGNKTRKLEYLVANALEHRADTLITCGAAQSNHARQTAAAAVKFGLHPILVLRGARPSGIQGNLLLDHLVGAELVWAGDQPLSEGMNSISQELRERGRRPYIVPYGGSNLVGATGYVTAMDELLHQCEEQNLSFDRIIVASSSGGTQAGLAVGASALGYKGGVLGISVDLEADQLRRTVADLATATAKHLGLALSLSPAHIAVNDDYLGGGYGVISDLEREAISTVARAEGLLLDPVYTGRAFGGLLDMIRNHLFEGNERVLFWHTGGTAGLFARTGELAFGRSA